MLSNGLFGIGPVHPSDHGDRPDDSLCPRARADRSAGELVRAGQSQPPDHLHRPGLSFARRRLSDLHLGRRCLAAVRPRIIARSFEEWFLELLRQGGREYWFDPGFRRFWRPVAVAPIPRRQPSAVGQAPTLRRPRRAACCARGPTSATSPRASASPPRRRADLPPSATRRPRNERVASLWGLIVSSAACSTDSKFATAGGRRRLMKGWVYTTRVFLPVSLRTLPPRRAPRFLSPPCEGGAGGLVPA